MPTYSYACTECGNRFDAVQAFSDDSLTSCPKCSGRLRKLFGSVGVVFKGSGFYRTDSRESAKASSNGSSSSGSPESTTSSSSSSDKSSSDKSSSDKSSASSSNGSSSTSSAPAAAASS